ncbi:hypothetical protein [Falsibacillus albus]|uniref:hypothetical protein n=1 Tax=Falsibacillus albus TaxID=2478915 RepID=UPI0013140179|nr:hypothetical protein [Falsibacillus albus]
MIIAVLGIVYAVISMISGFRSTGSIDKKDSVLLICMGALLAELLIYRLKNRS